MSLQIAKFQERIIFLNPVSRNYSEFWGTRGEEQGHNPLPLHCFHILLESAFLHIFQHVLI